MCYLCKLDNVSVMDLNEDLQCAADAVKGGKVILYPTDTVWGIGCDATDSDAVRRIYAIKRRSDSKAMLLLGRLSVDGKTLLPRRDSRSGGVAS